MYKERVNEVTSKNYLHLIYFREIDNIAFLMFYDTGNIFIMLKTYVFESKCNFKLIHRTMDIYTYIQCDESRRQSKRFEWSAVLGDIA